MAQVLIEELIQLSHICFLFAFLDLREENDHGSSFSSLPFKSVIQQIWTQEGGLVDRALAASHSHRARVLFSF